MCEKSMYLTTKDEVLTGRSRAVFVVKSLPGFCFFDTLWPQDVKQSGVKVECQAIFASA